MQKQMEYKEGKLIISINDGIDADKDGIQSLKAGIAVEINAMEAVNEMIKNEVPEWLKELMKDKI